MKEYILNEGNMRAVRISSYQTDEAHYWIGDFFEDYIEDLLPAHTVTTLNYTDLTHQAKRWLKGEDVFGDWPEEEDNDS